MACLREEVVAGCRLLDGAMIFATAFAPFHRRAYAIYRCCSAG